MKPKIDIKKLNPVHDIDIRPVTTYQPSDFFGEKKLYNNIDFDVMLDNGMPLQRDYVWTIEQKRNLIISMLCEKKFPAFYLICYTDDFIKTGKNSDKLTFKVIDGKQRLSTIKDFIENKFPILYEGYEYYFSDLTSMQKYRINCYSMDFHLVYEYHDEKLGDEKYVSLFNYVNFGGTPQEIEHMKNLEKSLKKN